jgi:tRNA-specific 2-thiouridylase
MRALVAMSGGVDSSVAAALMLEEGHDVIGVTLKQWEGPGGAMPTAGCCTLADAEDARRVAAQLDIPYYVLDHVDDFADRVVARFGADYAAGRTPNPCIDCNRRVRFNVLLDRVNELGCDVLVTGHYARVDLHDGRYRLRKGIDPTKDQSYVLHMLGQAELERVRLPIGEMHKTDVRAIAGDLGLRTASKPDSQDICFVGDGDYRVFLRTHFPQVAKPGAVVDIDGAHVADHEGTVDFTIGQRKGLGVAVGEPRYVVDIQSETSTVVIGRREDLLVDGCELEEVSFVADTPPSDPAIDIKVRYRARPQPARITREDGWRVRFDRPIGSVAPGQAAVFYDGDAVIGGGTISATFRD